MRNNIKIIGIYPSTPRIQRVYLSTSAVNSARNAGFAATSCCQCSSSGPGSAQAQGHVEREEPRGAMAGVRV